MNDTLVLNITVYKECKMFNIQVAFYHQSRTEGGDRIGNLESKK